MTVRAGVYLRISQDRGGEQLGIARQREDCMRKIADRGWTFIQEYVDNDVSASSTKVRPEYQRMLRDLREGVIDAVAVWDIDRLTRRPIEIEEFIELADDHGIALASVGGDVDIATDSGRLYLRIMAAFARDEVEKKSRRQRRQRQQAAETGEQIGGPRAFGYTEDGMHLDPDEAPLVKDAYQQFLAGASLMSLAKTWNLMGVTTPKGRPFRAQTVRTILANPRNAAVRGVRHLLPGRAGRAGARQTWHTVVGSANWPAIVDREVWEAVMVILRDPKRSESHVGNKQKYLLSGIARCGECDAKLVTGRRDQTRILKCPTMRHISRKAEPIEEFVLEVLMAKMADPVVAQALHSTPEGQGVDVAELRSRSMALRVRRGEATDDYSDLRIDRAERDRIHERIDVALREIDDRLASAMRTDRSVEMAGVDDPLLVWNSWPLEIQRKVLDRRLHVVVHSGQSGRPGGRRFDPNSISVTWRP